MPAGIPAASSLHAAGRLWTTAALVSLRLGDSVAAEGYAHSAIGHFEQSGQKVQEIHPMLVLLLALLRQKKFVEAEAATARTLSLAREVGFSEPYDRFNGRKDLERLWRADVPPYAGSKAGGQVSEFNGILQTLPRTA